MNIQTNTYGIPVTLTGAPNNSEELDALIGRANATFDLAIEKLVAHVVLGKVRDGLADAMVAEGFPKETKTSGDKELEVKPDKHWFAKGFAALGWDAAKRQQVCQAVADAVGFDVTSSRGLSGGPTKEDLKNSEQLLAAIAAGRSTHERVKTNLEARNPGLDIMVNDEGEMTADALASALGFERRRIAAEIKAATGGASLL